MQLRASLQDIGELHVHGQQDMATVALDHVRATRGQLLSRNLLEMIASHLKLKKRFSYH